MSQQGTIHRYSLLIEKLSHKQFPSFKIIHDHLHDQGFEISSRTLQRDIEQIRNEFGIEIKFDHSRGGYFIDKDESINVESFLRFLEIVSVAHLLTESLKESKESLNYISFEAQGSLKGIEMLQPLLSAIRNRRKISFTHENFETGKKRNYLLLPYLLHEYQNRWYIVGKSASVKELMTFGIDRIENLEVSNETFKRDKAINPAERFENIVGLYKENRKPEEILLSFNLRQAKYEKALPLHSSQEIITENENEVVMKYYLIPNYELKQKILMRGESVKVVEPKWLAGEIKTMAGAISHLYHE
ncbi:MAG: WYL domain-containing protein [Chitinophagales bacterium]|nr:WYL domain-containing protein [Chitinophagales bacterium]